jgi:hypothetical protein
MNISIHVDITYNTHMHKNTQNPQRFYSFYLHSSFASFLKKVSLWIRFFSPQSHAILNLKSTFFPEVSQLKQDTFFLYLKDAALKHY